MEKTLQIRIQEILGSDNVTGCIVTDRQGLCLAASSNIKPDVAGIVSAISKQAAKIEPDGGQPVILIENDHRQCLIHEDGGITTALFKKNTP